MGCDGFSSPSSLGFDKRNKRRSGDILEAVCEMAAASLHNDVLLDSEERHERASHCASAYDDSLVGRIATAGGLEMATKVSS